jgi:integrase
MSALVALPGDHDETLAATLHAAVGDAVSSLRFALDDALFGEVRCQVGGCPNPNRARGLCHPHYARWKREGSPPLDGYVATTGVIRHRPSYHGQVVFDLEGISWQARLEVAYVLQHRRGDRAGRLEPSAVRHLIGVLADTQAGSLLDRPVPSWLKTLTARGGAGSCHAVALVRYAHGVITDLADGNDAEAESARDVWRAARIGVPRTRALRRITFTAITQPWLRAPIKRWARFRLGAGLAFETVRGNVDALRWFSAFLAEQHPAGSDASVITRAVLEHFLSWLSQSTLSARSRNGHLVCLRSFLDACHRHGWLPELPVQAVIYGDELPQAARPLPRFIPEFVMAQLENPDNLAQLTDPTVRNLVVVIMETGLRASDACALPFNPIIGDSVGWPCLKFLNAKMAAEQMVPLSPAAAEAIRAQQAHLEQAHAEPPGCLFPTPLRNPDRSRPFAYNTLRVHLARWQDAIDLRDETGQPVRVTLHQFRHTLGTRMINAGIPQHVIQRLLGHASPDMTARYATIHDTTVRAAFDDYQRRRVDITGARLDFEPNAPTADAEWVKHNLARVAASLPNGYCGRPPQQDCPHPNACLTCPDFQTTPAFLPIHRRQRDGTLELIDAAEQAGNHRLAANHRQVHANLHRVIGALEAIDAEEPTDAAS